MYKGAHKFNTYTDKNGKTYLGEKDVASILGGLGLQVSKDPEGTNMYSILYAPGAYKWQNGAVTETDVKKIRTIANSMSRKIKKSLLDYAASEGRDLWREEVDQAIYDTLHAIDRAKENLEDNGNNLPDYLNSRDPYPVTYKDSPYYFRMAVVLLPYTGVFKDPETGRNAIDWTGWDLVIDQVEKIIDHADKLQRMKPSSTNGARYEQHKEWMYNTKKRFEKLLAQKLPFNVKENGDFQTIMHYMDEFMKSTDRIVALEGKGQEDKLAREKEQTLGIATRVFTSAERLLDALIEAKEDPDSWKAIAVRSMMHFMVKHNAIGENSMKWLVANTKNSKHKSMVKLANTYFWSSNRMMTKDILERILERA